MSETVGVKLQLKAVDRLTSVFQKASSGLDRLSNATKNASNAFQRLKEKTAGIRKAVDKIGSGFKNVGQNLSTKVTLPIVGMGAGIIATAANFEKSMNKVRALTRASGDDFSKMRDLAKELGSSTKFSASEAADAMAFLGMAGFKTNQIIQATPALLDLAAASNIELARAADIASNVMGAFEIQAGETSRVADVLARATSGANVDMEMIAESMKDAAPLAKTFGASLEETTAAIGLLGNIGIQGSKAGTALKNAFLNLSAPTAQSKQALEALGIQVADGQGNMLKFGEIMRNLGTRLSALPQKGRLEALNLIFGKIGISAATNLAKVAQTGELEKFTKAMFDTGVTAKSMADTMNAGASGAMVTFKSAMEGLAIAIAGEGPDSPLGAFTAIVQKISSFVQSISKTNPQIFKMAIVAAGLVAALGPVLFIFGQMTLIIPPLIALASALGISFGVFTASIVGIPILIGAIGVAVWALIKNWQKVKDVFANVWTYIKEKVKNLLSILPEYIQTKIGITPEIQEVINKPDISPKNEVVPELEKPSFITVPDVFKKMPAFESLSKVNQSQTLNKPNFPTMQSDLLQKEIPNNIVELAKPREIRRAEIPGAKNENKVTVKFENPPKGMTLKTESTDESLFSIDTGIQAAGI